MSRTLRLMCRNPRALIIVSPTFQQIWHSVSVRNPSSLREIFKQRHHATDHDHRTEIHQKPVEVFCEIDSIKENGRQFQCDYVADHKQADQYDFAKCRYEPLNGSLSFWLASHSSTIRTSSSYLKSRSALEALRVAVGADSVQFHFVPRQR